MKATEIKAKIDEIDRLLFKLSDEIAGQIEYDGIDIVYVSSKFTGLLNTAKHIESQLKFKKKTSR